MKFIRLQKIIIPILLIILLTSSAIGAVIDDTQAMRDLQDRLERNKAEIIKAITDANIKSQNTSSKAVDDNFAVLDKRIDDFFKTSKREIAIIMVGGFLVAFTLSQIIRLKVEQRQRKGLVRKALELESAVQRLWKDATELSVKVRQLKVLDEQYTKDLKHLTRKEPLITPKMVVFGIMTLLIGAILTYFLVK